MISESETCYACGKEAIVYIFLGQWMWVCNDCEDIADQKGLDLSEDKNVSIT